MNGNKNFITTRLPNGQANITKGKKLPIRPAWGLLDVMGKYKILGVFTGKTAPLANGTVSAIIKHQRDFITIRKEAIEGDQVTDKRFHGGEMRVVHQYTQKNYAHLKEKFPELAQRFVPGSFGENILTEELTEQDMNIGDIYALGSAKIQLTVPRRPCATINHGYNDERILKEVIHSGRTGWFFRVLEEGKVRAGDYLEILESPFPDLSVLKLHEQGYGAVRFNDPEFLKRCLVTGLMDHNWKPKIESALGILS